MKITILGEPKAKQRPRMGKGYVYTPQQTVMYENYVKACFYEQSNTKLQGKLKVSIIAFLGIPQSKSKKQQTLLNNSPCEKKPDCDNLAKIILDSLNGLAYDDDKQVVDLHVLKFYNERPRVELEITEIIES